MSAGSVDVLQKGLREGFQPLKMSELKQRARNVGVADLLLSAADDADNPKEAVITLIIETQAATPTLTSRRRTT